MKPGFLIPVYKHGATLARVLQGLAPLGLPIIVVDDGNDAENRAAIQAAAGTFPSVTLVTREQNGGKGRAIVSGVHKALELGWTHAFQLDADGQHDSDDCPQFLAQAEQNPESVICGYPLYDESVPEKRRSGRRVANGWARFVTLDGSIGDVLCGFRVYPLAAFAKALRAHPCINGRMGFDVEILVYLLWRAVPLVNLPVHVTYPEGGISNFRMVRDNVSLSLTFTRLCVGMLLRLPVLVWRAWRRKSW